MSRAIPPFTTGLPNLDSILERVMPGDNIVWRIDSVEDYLPFVKPYCQMAREHKLDFVYLRFAQHIPLVEAQEYITVYTLHPERGFESFMSEVFAIIEKHGQYAYYLFDCLSELVADWYSDRLLGIFFQLTCPYLYTYDTVTYFGLLKNQHSSHAVDKIHNTAQVVLDVYRNSDNLFIHPLKVYQRYSKTMYMLHVREGDDFHPVMKSAEVTEILARVPQQWLEFSNKRPDAWTTVFSEAQETLNDVRLGKRPRYEIGYYFQKLLRMAFSREPQLVKLAQKHLSIEDLLMIKKRMIGTGLIGGKSAGMLLSRAILRNHDHRWESLLEAHDSFFIGSDFYYTYMVENDCWWVLRKQRDAAAVIEGSEEAYEKMQHGVFPEDILRQFMEVLDYFGQSPIIVRSSSLLEDNYGNAFSGKYESVFCTNQGSPQDRLEAFTQAVRTVYASTMSQEALQYRMHRGLLDKDEQMGLLVQRVSGGIFGELFFPEIAGVGFSFNPYVWNEHIDPRAGMLRLVFGLGTRAVDRSDDDYTRIVALNAPELRPEAGAEQERKYSQRRVDVLDLVSNQFQHRDFMDMTHLENLSLGMVSSRDYTLEQELREKGYNKPLWKISFEELFKQTAFTEDMKSLLSTLEQAYGCPVDVEFTANFMTDGSYRINLVQCRTFQVTGELTAVKFPKDIDTADLIFKTAGPVIGPGISDAIPRLVYVNSRTYSNLGMNERYQVARVIGEINKAGKKLMLLGPGRWGTSSPSMGVPVTYSEINHARVICEVSIMHDGLIPDVSLGTHFFNDLVEAGILYLAVTPGKSDNHWNDAYILAQPNQLPELYPQLKEWASIIHLIDSEHIALYADALSQRAICCVGKNLSAYRGEE